MFCASSNDLVTNVSIASARYFEACTRLMRLAAGGAPLRFKEAQEDCQTRKDECTSAKEALRLHRAAHGC